MSRRGGQALSTRGEESYKDLIYLNDTYKLVIMASLGQKETSLDRENSLNASYDIQPLQMQKTNQFLGFEELAKHCRAALVPFVGLQNMVGL